MIDKDQGAAVRADEVGALTHDQCHSLLCYMAGRWPERYVELIDEWRAFRAVVDAPADGRGDALTAFIDHGAGQ